MAADKPPTILNGIGVECEHFSIRLAYNDVTRRTIHEVRSRGCRHGLNQLKVRRVDTARDRYWRGAY